MSGTYLVMDRKFHASWYFILHDIFKAPHNNSIAPHDILAESWKSLYTFISFLILVTPWDDFNISFDSFYYEHGSKILLYFWACLLVFPITDELYYTWFSMRILQSKSQPVSLLLNYTMLFEHEFLSCVDSHP